MWYLSRLIWWNGMSICSRKLDKIPKSCLFLGNSMDGIHETWKQQFRTNRKQRATESKSILVGGWTNPFEKYESKWESSPNSGENKKYLKPPPSIQISPSPDSDSVKGVYSILYHLSDLRESAPLPLTPARLLDCSPQSTSCSISLGLTKALAFHGQYQLDPTPKKNVWKSPIPDPEGTYLKFFTKNISTNVPQKSPKWVTVVSMLLSKNFQNLSQAGA